MIVTRSARAALAGLLLGSTALLAAPLAVASAAPAKVQHVLLISLDGLHESDLTRFVKSHPGSALAGFLKSGVHYTKAYTPFPSDSFPGLTALLTGANPQTAGFYYDDTYSRTLSAPDSACKTKGTEVDFTEDLDLKDDVDAGGIDPKKLPLDSAANCTPVWPHSYLKVNTVFEVAKAAGMTTAWSDKHPAYEFVNGPSGKGVDDLFVPEIAANKTDSSIPKTLAYDDTKVDAILHEIDGFDHTGTKAAAVPAIFGMNFQGVSVGEKFGGYKNAAGEPTADFEGALEHTDASLAKIAAELKAKNLADSTLVIVTAKHGQAPIDPAKRKIVDEKIIPDLINGVQKDLLAFIVADDIALIYLSDQSKTAEVTKLLNAHKKEAAIDHLFTTAEIARMFADPATDSRVPDIIIQPVAGTVYAKPTAKKLSEHGGMGEDNQHVGLIVSQPGLKAKTVSSRVGIAEVAPTILAALGLNPKDLAGAVADKTPVLPGVSFKGR